jgi:UDP-glucuronate 4-epimerase
LLEKAIGRKAEIRQLPTQPGDVPITYADISKAKHLLGYQPKIAIEAGIKKFVEWYQRELGGPGRIRTYDQGIMSPLL